MKRQEEFDSEVCASIIEHIRLSKSGERFLFEERKFKAEVIDRLKIRSIETNREVLQVLQAKYTNERLIDSGLFEAHGNKLYFKAFAPCLLIPYYDYNEKLVALQMRTLKVTEKPLRFLFASKSRISLYNMQSVSSYSDNSEVFIAEGITDCIALLSTGKQAVAIPSATSIPFRDIDSLRRFQLLMCPDNDDAGKKAYNKILEHMIRHMSYVDLMNYDNRFKDFCDYYTTCLSQNVRED